MFLEIDPVLDGATIALAVGTFILAVSAFVTAWYVRTELRLTREQHQSTVVMAWPELDAQVSDIASGKPLLQLHYVHGSQAAYDVTALVKSHDAAFAGEFGPLSSLRSHITGRIAAVPLDTRWEATTDSEPMLADGDVWIALAWTRSDGERRHLSWVMRRTPIGHQREWAARSRRISR